MHCDVLAFSKRQEATGHGDLGDGGHPTTLVEQPSAGNPRDPGFSRRVLGPQPASDRSPERLTVLASQTRVSWNPPCGPPSDCCRPTFRSSHVHTSNSRCCSDRLNPPSAQRKSLYLTIGVKVSSGLGVLSGSW